MNNHDMRNPILSPWDELRNHPGEIARLRWELLENFYRSVVMKNGVQLLALAEAPREDWRLRKRLWRNLFKNKDSGYDGEIVRLLHNYLASVESLTNHCRNLMSNYGGTSYYAEYETKVRLLSSLPETAFLKDLRNYIVHHKTPSVGMSISTVKNEKDSEFRSEALIYMSDLDDHHKWSSISRKYIDDSFPSIYLSDLIIKHMDALSDLYCWIFPHFFILHEDEYRAAIKIKESILRGANSYEKN